jgi:hypothetical protein
MIRRRFICALAPLLLTGALPAFAEDDAHKQVGQYVDLLPVGMPVVVDGQLVNYVLVNVRLNLAPGADSARWRAKEPYFRDALVRAGHATPFVVPGETARIDTAKLAAALMRAAQTITGPGVVRSVVVTKQVSSRRARPHA